MTYTSGSPKTAAPIKARFLLWAIVVLATVMYLASAFFAARSWAFQHDAIRAEGKVTRIVDKNGLHYPVYRFRDRNGLDREFTSSSGSSWNQGNAGDSVTILYARRGPDNPKAESFSELWAFPAILAGAGSLDLALGLAVVFLMEKVWKILARNRAVDH